MRVNIRQPDSKINYKNNGAVCCKAGFLGTVFFLTNNVNTFYICKINKLSHFPARKHSARNSWRSDIAHIISHRRTSVSV